MSEQPELPGLAEVSDAVSGVAAAFAAAGHRLYLVGGVVRDLVVGDDIAPADIDLTTDADPKTIRELVVPHATALWTQGERFGTIGATVNGRDLEITTHRSEVYDERTRKPVVAFGDSLDEDLSRRDFTINAMAVDVATDALIDPYGGLDDLKHRVLRTPLSPTVSFTDDPLRMMRAARFLPRFHLTVDEGVLAAARELAPRMAIVSVERIHHELERLLAVDEPRAGFDFLDRSGLMDHIVPPLGNRPAALADAIALASGPGSVLVRRAGLFAPTRGEATAAIRRLRYARAEERATLNLIAAIATLSSCGDLGDPSLADARRDEIVRRTLDGFRIKLDAVPDLQQLVANVLTTGSADGLAGSAEPLRTEPADAFFARLEELAAVEDLSDLGPPLNGRQVMDHLSLEPGPTVGLAVDHLRDHRLAIGPLDELTAIRLLDDWWRENRP